MVQIEDDYGKKYKIEDLNSFKLHIKKYHSKDGKGDGSHMKKMDIGFELQKSFMTM